MKRFILILFLLFSLPTFAQSGFYTWVGRSKASVVKFFGQPHATEYVMSSPVYIYYTKSGNTSFLIMNDIVFAAMNTIQFRNVTAALKGARFLATLCQKDGFKVTELETGYYEAISRRLNCKIKISVIQSSDGTWCVNEHAQ